MINENINRMIDLSMRKKQYLMELLDLTQKQGTIIEEEKLDELDKILKEKDKVMEKVDELDSQFLSIFNQIKDEEKIDDFEKLPVEKYENVKELKAVIGEINNILNSLSILDKNNIAKMKAKVEETQAQLKNIRMAKKANKGYGLGDIGSVFLDEKK